MSEALTPNHIPIEAPVADERVAAIEKRREEFVGALLVNDLIDPSLPESGALDTFAADPVSGHDSLMHILVGDEFGGAHHLRTVINLGLTDRMVASRLTGSKSLTNAKLQRRQSVRENGTFRPKEVHINGREKAGGSAMFPNEWSTEKVINAVLRVAGLPPVSHDEERRMFIHDGEVDGVAVRAVTLEKSGKIVTAFPVLPKA